MSFDFSIDSPVTIVAALGFLSITLAGGLFGLHLKNRVPGFSFSDNLRAMAYLTQYDGALEYHGLRSRERRARVNELRGDLAESAADRGVRVAIQRLGPPRALAAAVAGDRMVPSWARGMGWLAVATAIGMGSLAMSASAFLAGAESAAAPGTTATWSTFFVTMTTTADQSSPGIFTLELSFATLLLLLVPFGIGSRVWRLATGRGARQKSA